MRLRLPEIEAAALVEDIRGEAMAYNRELADFIPWKANTNDDPFIRHYGYR
jgi:hypothetical protein